MKPLTPEQREDILDLFDKFTNLQINSAKFVKFIRENTVDITPPTIIYKGSGFTGAQKDERYREEE